MVMTSRILNAIWNRTRKEAAAGATAPNVRSPAHFLVNQYHTGTVMLFCTQGIGCWWWQAVFSMQFQTGLEKQQQPATKPEARSPAHFLVNQYPYWHSHGCFARRHWLLVMTSCIFNAVSNRTRNRTRKTTTASNKTRSSITSTFPREPIPILAQSCCFSSRHWLLVMTRTYFECSFKQD